MSKINFNYEVLQVEAVEHLNSLSTRINSYSSLLNELIIPEDFEFKERLESIKNNLVQYSNKIETVNQKIKNVNSKLDTYNNSCEGLVNSLPNNIINKREPML